METLTIDKMKAMEPMPPEETLRYVQSAFCREFLLMRQEQPLATRRAIIMAMLENPVWGEWGHIGSHQQACKVLDKACPGWREEENN